MTRKKSLYKYTNLTLTISKFMANYYNVKTEKLSKTTHKKEIETLSYLNKLTHDDLVEIFPFLETVAPKEITEENITAGNVILVVDRKHRILGYTNPYTKSNNIEEINETDPFLDVDTDNFEILNKINEEILKELNIYDLEQVLKLCKECKNYKIRKLVQKELYFRPENHSSDKKIKKLERIRTKEDRKEGIK